jgi:sensor histidine kinase YesM
MLDNLFTKKNLFKTLIIFGAWTFVAVIFTVKQSMSATAWGREISIVETFSIQFVSWAGWMLITFFIFFLGESWFPSGRNFYRNIFWLFLLGIGVVAFQTLHQALFLPMVGTLGGKMVFDTFSETYKAMLVSNWLLSSSLYLMTLGIVLVTSFYKKYQKRELESSKLEASLNRARLQVLQMQLHPHFLFNTHNAITELIHKDPDVAEKMLTNLSDMLRISLDNIEVEEVTLHQELEFVEKYIEIEQVRFQERLKFSLQIDPVTLDAIVPNMILQPLIENAVKHGISPLKEGGTIRIKTYLKEKSLFIRVSDDGVGLPAGEGNFVVKGIGLANTQARLLHLYKDDQSFQINPEGEKGFVVLIKLPFKVTEQKVRSPLELITPKLVENN